MDIDNSNVTRNRGTSDSDEVNRPGPSNQPDASLRPPATAAQRTTVYKNGLAIFLEDHLLKIHDPRKRLQARVKITRCFYGLFDKYLAGGEMTSSSETSSVGSGSEHSAPPNRDNIASPPNNNETLMQWANIMEKDLDLVLDVEEKENILVRTEKCALHQVIKFGIKKPRNANRGSSAASGSAREQSTGQQREQSAKTAENKKADKPVKYGVKRIFEPNAAAFRTEISSDSD